VGGAWILFVSFERHDTTLVFAAPRVLVRSRLRSPSDDVLYRRACTRRRHGSGGHAGSRTVLRQRVRGNAHRRCPVPLPFPAPARCGPPPSAPLPSRPVQQPAGVRGVAGAGLRGRGRSWRSRGAARLEPQAVSCRGLGHRALAGCPRRRRSRGPTRCRTLKMSSPASPASTWPSPTRRATRLRSCRVCRMPRLVARRPMCHCALACACPCRLCARTSAGAHTARQVRQRTGCPRMRGARSAAPQSRVRTAAAHTRAHAWGFASAAAPRRK